MREAVMPPASNLPTVDILNSLHEGLYVLDRDRNIIFWNQGAEKIAGFSAEEVLGYSCADNILTHVDEEGTNLCHGACPVAQTLEDGRFREAEVYLHHKEGHRVPVVVRVTPLLDDDGRVVGAVEVFADNSMRREERLRMSELEKMALLDGLTQLPNRRYMEQMLLSRLSEFQRAELSFGILMMDLDHFKLVNDTHGHNVGDEVLRTVSRTLIEVSRPYDLVGRWGGEEFLALLPNIDRLNLFKVGERYRAMVERTRTECAQGDVCVTLSAGAASVRPGDSLESLVERADQQLYQAKEAGRNRVFMD